MSNTEEVRGFNYFSGIFLFSLLDLQYLIWILTFRIRISRYKADELQGEVANFFKTIKKGFLDILSIQQSSYQTRKRHICEALDYLTISSSKNILKLFVITLQRKLKS
jgi:nanoRNase/pAp phosphatase (c-di-AMP/oligoRNAs hydrolase)